MSEILRTRMPRKEPALSLMDRTRAAVCYLNSNQADSDAEMHAFMALFHPEKDPYPVVRAARKNRE